MRKLRKAIRTLDQLDSEDYLLASEEAATVADQCRRALIEAGHADHAESLSDLGGRADPQIAGDRLRSILAAIEAIDTPTLTVAQAARRYGIGAKTIYRLCVANRLKHSRIGAGRGTIRIRPEDLDRYLQQAAQPELPKGSGLLD